MDTGLYLVMLTFLVVLPDIYYDVYLFNTIYQGRNITDHSITLQEHSMAGSLENFEHL